MASSGCAGHARNKRSADAIDSCDEVDGEPESSAQTNESWGETHESLEEIVHNAASDDGKKHREESQEHALILIRLSWIEKGKPVQFETDSHHDYESGNGDQTLQEKFLNLASEVLERHTKEDHDTSEHVKDGLEIVFGASGSMFKRYINGARVSLFIRDNT